MRSIYGEEEILEMKKRTKRCRIGKVGGRQLASKQFFFFFLKINFKFKNEERERNQPCEAPDRLSPFASWHATLAISPIPRQHPLQLFIIITDFSSAAMFVPFLNGFL